VVWAFLVNLICGLPPRADDRKPFASVNARRLLAGNSREKLAQSLQAKLPTRPNRRPVHLESCVAADLSKFLCRSRSAMPDGVALTTERPSTCSLLTSPRSFASSHTGQSRA